MKATASKARETPLMRGSYQRAQEGRQIRLTPPAG